MATKSAASRASFISKYSIATFFILVMVLGGGSILLVTLGTLPSGAALLSALSASVAGIIMTLLDDGITGLKLMLRRLLIWRVGFGYWLFAIFFFFTAILIGTVFNPLFNGDLLSFNGIQPTLEIFLLFVSFFIVAGLGQELGWTGFLVPRLQARYNAFSSSVFRAVLEGFWHLPLLFYAGLQHPALADFPYDGWIAQRGFLVTAAVLFFIFLVPWSIFFSWIFNNTKGSLLLVAVLHGSEFWVAYWMLSTGINPKNLNNYWGYGTILVITAILIVVMTGPQNLSRTKSRIVHQRSSG